MLVSISNDTALFHIAQTAFHFLEEMQKSFTVNIIFNIYPKLSQQKDFAMKKKWRKRSSKLSKIIVRRIFYGLIKKIGRSSSFNRIITIIWEHFRFVECTYVTPHFWHSISITVRSYVMHIPPGCFLLHLKMREKKICPFLGLVPRLISGNSD